MSGRTAWANPRATGAGQWRPTARPQGSGLRLTLLGTVVVCFALMGLFLAAEKAGRALVCHVDHYASGYATHSYCPGYIPTTTTPETTR